MQKSTSSFDLYCCKIQNREFAHLPFSQTLPATLTHNPFCRFNIPTFSNLCMKDETPNTLPFIHTTPSLTLSPYTLSTILTLYHLNHSLRQPSVPCTHPPYCLPISHYTFSTPFPLHPLYHSIACHTLSLITPTLTLVTILIFLSFFIRSILFFVYVCLNLL